MGLHFRTRVRLGRRLTANLSRRGVSLTGRAGPLHGNTRGGWGVRLPFGFTWRGRWR